MIKYPDYKDSIVNLSSTILNSFGANHFHPVLQQLDSQILKSKKNIVLIVLDGFGLNLLNKYKQELPWFYAHLKSPLTSVFPPTTSAAITSIISGKTPYEHGIIGWTLFFKEFGKYIDFLPTWDTITMETMDAKKYNIYDIMHVETIFHQIHNEDNLCFNVTPAHISQSASTLKNAGEAIILGYNNNDQMIANIHYALSLKHEGRKFIYAYNPDPDHTEHKEGINSKTVLSYLKEMDKKLAELAESLEDTILLLTADHGLIDIEKYFYVNEDKDLFNSLLLPTFPEPRFNSFFAKPSKEKNCEQALKKYEDDFLIMKRDDFLASGILGSGTPHPKLDDFVGDFVAIAHKDKALKWIFQQNGKWKKELVAHHAGLNEAEMVVPLIYFES